MKRAVLSAFFGSLCVVVLISGCVWDNEQDLFPEATVCDTTMVSFSADIVPILSNHCYGCHSNLNAPIFAGGLSFEDYEDVARYSERIVGAINHNDGFEPMPRGAARLDPCPINLIEAWVNAGTPDN
ncbi:MAG: hypothetical protein ACWGNV_04950 [Bacteroidales bacterium]